MSSPCPIPNPLHHPVCRRKEEAGVQRQGVKAGEREVDRLCLPSKNGAGGVQENAKLGKYKTTQVRVRQVAGPPPPGVR